MHSVTCHADVLSMMYTCLHSTLATQLNSVTGFDLTATQGPWAWQVAGADVAFLIGESIVYFLITLAIEYALAYPALAAMLQVHYALYMLHHWPLFSMTVTDLTGVLFSSVAAAATH
jgi:hypothetical protein